MANPLHVLILEDREADAELMVHDLRQAGFDPTWERVDTEADYLAKLDPTLDVILADYTLPQFLAPKALLLLQERGLDIPFIVVTGSVGEDVAVECIKQGAADCLVKWRLARLGAAVVRALEERRLREGKRRVDEALRETHERLEALIQASPLAIAALDPEGNVTMWNPAAERIFGWSAPEVLGRCLPFVPKDKDQEARTLREWVLEGEGFTGLELQRQKKDGSPVDISISTAPLHDAGGRVTGMVGIIADVTERKRAEERLRLQGTALHAAANAIIITDRDGQITWANPAFTQRAGYTLEEILGKNPRFLKSGRQEPSFYRTLWETILSGRVWSGEIVNRRKDGILYVEEQTIAPVRDDQRNITHFVSIRQDITERKLGEEALADRTRQLEAIRAVTQEITRELDLTTLLRLINRRATELVGATTGTVFLWDESAQVLAPQAWHGPGDWRGEIHLRLGEGVAGTVAEQRAGLIVNDYRSSRYALPIFLEHTKATAVLGEPLLYRGRLLGVITVDNEETGTPFTQKDRECLALFATQAAIAIENAQLYEAIRRHAAELEARVEERTRDLADASRHKSEFLANMSHELRTSLNSIMVFAQILQEQTEEVLSPKQARFLTNIYSSGEHILQLINDTLDLSKVEAGKIVLQPEALPLEETLEDTLSIVRGFANKKDQTIRVEIPPNLPTLHADPIRFKQILLNLLSNAVKFTTERGTITVTARRICDFRFPISDFPNHESEPQSQIANRKSEINDWLEIAVADSGIGIKAEDLPRLFQEFVQLEGPANTRHGGTGLGLALTKRLVELHGGRIWGESPGEGQGSTFRVVLPFAGSGEISGREPQ